MKTLAVLVLLASTATAGAQAVSKPDRAELRTNCGSDIRRLCAHVEPGEGQLQACMAQNKDQLSQSCAATIGRIIDRQAGR